MQHKEYMKVEDSQRLKTLDPAFLRMRTRTAKQQLADTLAALRGPEDIPLPDADDSSIRGVLR